MLRNWAKKLTGNLGLKILALLFAVILWMAVVNLDDPTINKPFTVGVTIENENFISSMGKYYEIDSDSMNVTFSVMGKRSIINQLNNSDFKATADMRQIIIGETENFVPVEITAQRSVNQLTIFKRAQRIRVNLEDLMRKPFIIQPVFQGDPAEGYALDTMDVTPNVLRVSGPKAVVSKIDIVNAVIDVSGMSTEITDNVVPVLMDKNGKAIDITKLTLNLNTVTVKASVVSEKKVPIKVKYTGKPADGFEVVAVHTDPEEISIKGNSDILNAINAITIPEGLINVQDTEEPLKQQVDITKYLPSGVSLSDSTQASVMITVDVEELERRGFNVPVENIDIDNLPENYRIKFNSRQVNIIVYGLKADLDQLTADAIHPILDVEGLTAGSHVDQLQISLDSKYIVGETNVSYTIYTNEEPGQSGDSPDSEDGETGVDDETTAGDDMQPDTKADDRM